VSGNYLELLEDKKEPVDIDTYLEKAREKYARDKKDVNKMNREKWFDEEGHYYVGEEKWHIKQ
jgi:hypothetical protein